MEKVVVAAMINLWLNIEYQHSILKLYDAHIL